MKEDVWDDNIELIMVYFAEEQKWTIQQRLGKVNYQQICLSLPFADQVKQTKKGSWP